MRTTYALTALAVVLTATNAHAGPQVMDAAGGFSYTAPDGWRVTNSTLSKYKIAVAKPVGGFAANFIAVQEDAPTPLPNYVRVSVAYSKSGIPGYHLVSQTPFVTNSGLHGFKVVTDAANQSRKLRQSYFFFSGHGTRKMIMIVSVPQAQAAKYAAPIDAAMKTLTIK